ncbi:crossover junction endonuclease MUS81 isoform X2 [Sceloporus undulatus]|uniref:crossover junction endonuclease MUS81 isoform X2 n=1 Tax=Sceloporus undulatus TaxID=8520 RepID=UPI001C4AEF91|nr:crossover junction endonuclease MUS81 isoform X2 [Sceloporus undulatus]
MAPERYDFRVKKQKSGGSAGKAKRRLWKMPKPPPPCPNPLFMQWLQEWRDEAAERGRPRSQKAYERALSSLRKYPLPLRSGREARILQYFGEQICRQLDERLERHRGGHDGAAPTDLQQPAPSLWPLDDGEPLSFGSASASHVPVPHSAAEPAQCPEQRMKKKQPASCKRARVPAPRSAAYAVLLALYQDSMDPESRGYLTKPELQRAAQPLCNKSFCLADPGDKKTAWSAVGNLIRKELVLKTNIPARYSLTEAGLSLAQELVLLEEPKNNATNSTSAGTRESLQTLEDKDEGGQHSSQSEKEAAFPEEVAFPEPNCREPHAGFFKPQCTLRPGQFEVILCVDFIETTGGPTSRKQDLVNELRRNNIPFSVRKLHVGDFLWVAREKVSPIAGQLHPPSARELVLDYVVERKKMPDLCSSIIDGRFREQKFRLRQCGLSHPIYLVEDSGSVEHLSLPGKTLQQAVINTQVVDGFFVKRTRDIRESAAYLTIMTRHLTRLYGDKTLLSCTKEELERECPLPPSEGSCHLLTFAEFNEGAVKNKAQTVREVFARQLMQISGISGDKAAAILELYKTPSRLLDAYAACPTPQAQEQLLSGIRCGKLQRNLGPVLSKTLAQLYCTPGPLL